MADKTDTPDSQSDTSAAPNSPPVKRGAGHRGAEVKDTVAEMAAKAHEISLEAGSRMAAAMKDVINAAAGITGFVVESARDLTQYMVRRGQMTQEEADKLIQQAEEAQVGRPAPKASEAASKAKAAAEPKVVVEDVKSAPESSESDDDLEIEEEVEVESEEVEEDTKPAAKAAAKTASKPAAKVAAKSTKSASEDKAATEKTTAAKKTTTTKKAATADKAAPAEKKVAAKKAPAKKK